jgi:hypothetical protein
MKVVIYLLKETLGGSKETFLKIIVAFHPKLE